MSDGNNKGKSSSGELSVTGKGVTAKGDAYEDLRPVVKGLVGITAPILYTMADALALSRGWATSRLQGVADRYGVKLLEMPENQRQLPPPEISASVISRAIYAENDSALHELFAELLISASDSSRAGQAHVAFAAMISELEPLDAEILTFFKGSSPNNTLFRMEIIRKLGVDQDDDSFKVACGNLQRLGLVKFVNKETSYRGRMSSGLDVDNTSEIIEYVQNLIPSDDYLELTPLGNRFFKACVASTG